MTGTELGDGGRSSEPRPQHQGPTAVRSSAPNPFTSQPRPPRLICIGRVRPANGRSAQRACRGVRRGMQIKRGRGRQGSTVPRSPPQAPRRDPSQGPRAAPSFPRGGAVATSRGHAWVQRASRDPAPSSCSSAAGAHCSFKTEGWRGNKKNSGRGKTGVICRCFFFFLPPGAKNIIRKFFSGMLCFKLCFRFKGLFVSTGEKKNKNSKKPQTHLPYIYHQQMV